MKKFYLLIVIICLGKLSFCQLTVTTFTANSTICAGGSSSITASITPAAVDPITYSWSPATGLNTTTGPTVIASPASTTTYTVTATNTNTSQTGNTTITITIDPASYSLAGIAGGAQVCQNVSISGSATTYRDGNCKLIASIEPAGVSPVSGSVNTCVRVDTGANKMGSLDFYVARHYDIEPATNPSTSTANITLYFLQSEFDNYNSKALDSGLFNLPAGPGDATGISEMRIRQFHGTGTGPGLYSGGRFDFKSTTPGVSITWNAARNWWEIKVPVSGFSGFYISSRKGASILPISLEYFKGSQADKKNKLYWKANCSSSQVNFEIERSGTGQGFSSIGHVIADQARCSSPFDFTDPTPLYGNNYYRLKITDADGKSQYSNIVLLTMKYRKFELMAINPSVVGNDNAVIKINSLQMGEILIAITDMTGRRIETHTLKLHTGLNSLKLNTAALTQGGYLLGAYMAGEEPQTIQFIKQ